MRTLTHRLLSGSVSRSLSFLANGVVAFLLLPFLVRHLGDRLYGFWSLVATFIGYYGMLDFGLTATVAQYISAAIGRKDREECNVVFNTALRIHSLLGVAVLVVTAILAASAHLICSNPQDASLFWKVIMVLGVTVALSFPMKTFVGLLLAEMRFNVISWIDLSTLALRTSLIVWVILSGHKLLGLAWVTLFASLPGLALIMWRTKKDFPWLRIHRGPIGRKTTKGLFSYSAYIFAADIADRLRFQVDPILISAFVGLAAVTHYRIASVFADYYLRLMISLVGVFQPLLSQLYGANDHVGIKRTFFLATKISLCVSSFLCFGLIAWGKPMIQRWMGPKYMDAYAPLVVLSLALLLDLCQSPSVNLLYATFKHRFYAYANMCEGLLNLIFSLILVRRYGILGVALGTLIASAIVRVIVQPWWVCKVSALSYPTYMRFLLNNSVRCAALICVAYALVSWGLKPDYRFLFGSATLAAGIYGVGSWLLIFDKNERRRFWDTVMKRKQNLESDVDVSMPIYSEANSLQGLD
jgi:O-antigen/teichoic acid export membrane protein